MFYEEAVNELKVNQYIIKRMIKVRIKFRRQVAVAQSV
jgi:hypothetical protein